jgi:S-adenosylmethionine:tRNA ribosyltransferase-isomerase
MKLALFDYPLPPELIAYYPLKRRDSSRLMILDRDSGEVKHRKFPAIVEYFQENDGLVINDVKVFKARLFARRPSGGKIEIFLLEEVESEDGNQWIVLTHPSRRVKEGEAVFFDRSLSATIVKKRDDGKTTIAFKTKSEARRIISRYGHVPLPVYIHRPDEKGDVVRYQTIYADAKKAKAVAAPTAGFHFTRGILEKIKAKGVKVIPITLHVGHGTFKTIRTENIEEHMVDPEYAEISKASAKAINEVREKGGRIFAVGTTSVRTLESAELVNGKIRPFSGYVSLYIRPGHQFQIVDCLITNFHLPKSSLVILVSAFAGRERILAAYRSAIEEKYRFYSYGDCMLIL